jgi:hypothetical protein
VRVALAVLGSWILWWRARPTGTVQV